MGEKKYVVMANFFGPPYLSLGYVKDIADGKINWTSREEEALIADINELPNIFAKVWEFSKDPKHCDVYPVSLEVFADGTISTKFSHVKKI